MNNVLDYYDIVAALARKVFIDRNREYGNAGIARAGMDGIAEQVRTKVDRVFTATARTVQADCFIDVANYGLMGDMVVNGWWPGDDAERCVPGRLVYLACPIDQAAIGGHQISMATLSNMIAEAGFTCFCPSLAFRWNAQERDGQFIAAINKLALALSSGILAYLPTSVVTYGTVAEIVDSQTQNKVTAILVDADAPPSVFLIAHANVYTEPTRAIGHLADVLTAAPRGGR